VPLHRPFSPAVVFIWCTFFFLLFLIVD